MYSIKVTRSLFGSFYWEICSQGIKIASSGKIQNKEMCMKIAKKVSTKLNCKLEYLDLEKDYEE